MTDGKNAPADRTGKGQGSIASQPASLTYWQQTWRDFRRNRLAMFGLITVFLVATTGVFAPLIANNRPYMIKMIFADDYDEAYFIVLDETDGLRAFDPESSPRPLAEIRDSLDRALNEMAASLPEGKRTSLEQLAGPLRTQAREPKTPPPSSFEESLETFEIEFDLYEVTLQPQTRFPSFRALKRPEVFFMLFYLSLAGNFFIRSKYRKFRHYLAASLVPAILGTVVLTMIYPPVQDTFPYRDAFEEPAFGEKGEKVWKALVPFGENENLTAESRQPPTFLLPDEDRAENQHFHLMGTDTNGRSVLSRMIYGARISMMIGIVAVSIYVAIGIVLGALAGYFRGWVDLMLSRVIEVVICFPVLFLILSVQAFLEPSIINIMAALGLVYWTGVARLERGEFLRIVNMDYIMAVRALGGSHMRIIFQHVLPNALGPILVLISFGIAGSILVESALSFLGFGVPQPAASWGDLLNNGRNDIQGTWWLTVFPGFAIFLTVTCFNLVGEGVRDALDPRRDY